MKFVTMKQPLKHSVFNGSKEVIKAGAKRVMIAFRQSHLVRDANTGAIYSKDFDEPLDAFETRLNVYKTSWNSKLVHA